MTRPRLRVVFLTWELGDGGAERQLLHLIRGPWAPDVEPVLVAMDPPEAYVRDFREIGVRCVLPPHDTALPLERLLGHVRRTLPRAALLTPPLEYLAALGPLAAALQQLADGTPTIVVSSLFDLLPAAVLARDLLGGAFPIVAIEQVHPLDFFRHEVDLLPAARANYPRVLKDAYRRADRVIAVSAAIRGVLRTAFGVPAARLAHIPNGVETDRLAPDGPRAARFTIAGMGRLHPLKRYDLLLRGAHEARARTGVPADVLLLGQGPERDALAALARALGLDGLTLAGFTPEPWDRLSRAHVLVHASATEALPVAVLEAMALGLPVVATRWPGVEELVEDGVNGFVVDGTPEAIGRALALLQEDRALRARLGAAARAHSLRFDLRSVVLPAYRRELAALGPRARPVPSGFDLSLVRWLDGRRADVRLVVHRDREAPELAAVRRLVFEDAGSVPPPSSERYLLYTRQWPLMVERWVRDGGPGVLARCAWLHCP